MKKQLFASLIILCIVFTAGCTFPMQARADQVVLGTLGPEAWIDAPLDGMHIPLGVPYDVVFHITADSAVSRGELSINNGVVATLDNPSAGSNLATLHFSFTPPQPGKYKLQVRAQDSNNAWGDYFEAVVFVDEMTPTITPTQTITPTMTVTVTPTITITPTRSPEMILSDLTASQDVFMGSCAPNQVTLSVQVVPFQGVQRVVVYTQLSDGNSSGDYSEEMDLVAQGNGVFSRVMGTNKIPNTLHFSSAYLQYQFIAYGPGSQELKRTTLFRNGSVTACGGSFNLIPLRRVITPSLIPPPK